MRLAGLLPVSLARERASCGLSGDTFPVSADSGPRQFRHAQPSAMAALNVSMSGPGDKAAGLGWARRAAPGAAASDRKAALERNPALTT